MNALLDNNEVIHLMLIMRMILSLQGFPIGTTPIELNKREVKEFTIKIIALADGDKTHEPWMCVRAKEVETMGSCRRLRVWYDNAKENDVLTFK